jgi:hypothetical protein
LSPGGLPGCLVTAGTGTLLLSLGVIRGGRLGRVLRPGRIVSGPGLGFDSPGPRAGNRVVPLLPRRSQLLVSGLGSPRLRSPGGQP